MPINAASAEEKEKVTEWRNSRAGKDFVAKAKAGPKAKPKAKATAKR